MEKHTAPARLFMRYLALSSIAALLTVLFSRVVRVNQTTVALSFLVLIVVTASRWRLTYSVYLSVLCAVLYNFFFLPPVGTFTIADPHNWVALAAFLCTSFLVSHLSDRERRQAEASEARRREIELLYAFSQKLLLQDELSSVARTTPAVLASVFQMRAVGLYVRSSDTVFYSDSSSEMLAQLDLKQQSARDEAVLSVGEFRIMQLRLGMQHSLGTLAVTNEGYDMRTYEAIGSLISVALERAAALERTSRLEAARESEKLKSALIDSVTHDLRTPLTAIRAAATTLSSEHDLPEEQRTELVSIVDEESARLDQLIGQAVEMAQLDTETLRLDLSTQSVRELIEMTAEKMKYRLQNHTVLIRVPEALPEVRMDRRLIQRVLQHLIENAAKFSPSGKPIKVTGAVERDRVLITVADQGPGIDPEEMPFIFDKYFRGKRHKNTSKGTGMGLAIARAILKAHQGGIDVQSDAGRGSEFRFWIPLWLPEDAEPATDLAVAR